MKKILTSLLVASTLSVSMSLTVFGEVTDLTLEDAVLKAQKYNNALITVNEKKLETYDDMENSLMYLPTATLSSSGGVASNELYNNMLKLVKAQMTLVSSETDKKKQEDIVENSILKIFVTIRNAQNDLALAGMDIENAKIESKINDAKYKLGLISKSDYKLKNDEYSNKLLTERELATTLDNAFEDLNMYMNETKGKRYNLVFETPYKSAESIDLEYLIAYSKDADANVLQKKEDYKLAEIDLQMTTNASSSYISRTNKLNQADRAISDAKNQLEEKIRNAYSNILDIERNISLSDISIDNLSNTIAINKVKYKNGQITELDLLKSEYDFNKKVY